jgi:hypothetical protein
LPSNVVHLMDDVIFKGLGGYGTRHEFARDAIENHAFELLYGDEQRATEPDGQNGRHEGENLQLRIDADEREDRGSASSADGARGRVQRTRIAIPASVPQLQDAAETALRTVEPGLALENELAAVRDDPLIGLHNRDWPSLWGLRRLAEICREEPQPLRQAYASVTEDAWAVSRSLVSLEKQGAAKLRALLPSNEEKPHSAEEGFQAFALGAINRRPTEEGKLVATGPLFVWGALALVGTASDARLALTPQGWELLRLVDGLTVLTPHGEEHTLAFLAFLREHAQEDWFGFELVLQSAKDGLGRAELGERFCDAREWKESVAVSTSQGYLARSREWGLVEPKLVEGSYVLTPVGERVHASPPKPEVTPRDRASRKRRPRKRGKPTAGARS